MVTILHTIDVNATSDEYYKQLDLSSANVNCLTYDNDAPGLIASPRSVAVTENTGPGYYTLSLATEPTAPTLVNLTADPGLTAILDQTGEPWVWFTPEVRSNALLAEIPAAGRRCDVCGRAVSKGVSGQPLTYTTISASPDDASSLQRSVGSI
jgi:hypothetical protein